jgi:hypothetical protein
MIKVAGILDIVVNRVATDSELTYVVTMIVGAPMYMSVLLQHGCLGRVVESGANSLTIRTLSCNHWDPHLEMWQ